jgi:hypothetical protein
MATKDKQSFIKDLSAKHHRQRPLMPPLRRAVIWFAAAFIISAAWMHAVQVFRPGFVSQLAHHPFFLLEIASALLLAAAGAYAAFVHAIPGERIARGTSILLWVLTSMFIISLAAGFTGLAPESSKVGARHACWLEVVVYGATVLVVFLLMIRRGWVRFSLNRGLFYGVVAGLIPAALMQLACMYDPMHGVRFHYLPVVFLIPAGLLVMRVVHRK